MTSIGSYTGVLDGTTGAVSTVAGEGAKLLAVATAIAADTTATSGIAGSVMPETPTVVTVNTGGAGNDEESTITFKDLKAGQSITVAGLTVRAKADLMASDVAAAFANLSNDPAGYPLPDTSEIAFSGQLVGFTSAGATGADVAFTSTATNVNVTDISVTLDSTIESPLLQGTKGKFSGILSGFSTGAANGSTVTFKSSSNFTNVPDLTNSGTALAPTVQIVDGAGGGGVTLGGLGSFAKAGTLKVIAADPTDTTNYPDGVKSATFTLEDGQILRLFDKANNVTGLVTIDNGVVTLDKTKLDRAGFSLLSADNVTIKQVDGGGAAAGLIEDEVVGLQINRQLSKLETMYASDAIINGIPIGASRLVDDQLSPQNSGNQIASAIAKAAAINSKTDATGVFATVNPTIMTGAAMSGTGSVKGTVNINGFTTPWIQTELDNPRDSRIAVVNAINFISAQTGVRAIDSLTDNKGITLVADDGRNVEIVFNTQNSDSDFSRLTGLKQGVQSGTYSLESAVETPITVTTATNGNISRAGLELADYNSKTLSTVNTKTRAEVTKVSEIKTLGIGDLKINGVAIRAASPADDTLSSVTSKTSSRVGGAIATVAAINDSSELTGVTAKAIPVKVEGSVTSRDYPKANGTYSLFINGQNVPVAMTTTQTDSQRREAVIQAIQQNAGLTGVDGVDNGAGGITLTAVDGRNVSIWFDSDQVRAGSFGLGFGTPTNTPPGVRGMAGATVESTDAYTAYASIALESTKAINVEPGDNGFNSDGDFVNLGFSQGVFGGEVDQATSKMSPPRTGRLAFQIGANEGQKITIDLADFGKGGPITGEITWDADMDPLAPGSAIPDPVQGGPNLMGKPLTRTFISSSAAAQDVLKKLDVAMDKVNQTRATMGAVMNRLDHVINNLTNVSMNLSGSRSQIEDADYASASTELAKTQIMQQAATAVLAQANTSQQSVLKLLQG
jgi:flagellin-like hook-associated protein FlgL